MTAMAKLETLKDLYVEQLRDLYSAENQILKALPKMEKAAHDPALKAAFAKHLKQTEGQVERLATIFEGLGEKPTGHTCKAMEGLVAEGAETIHEKATPEVKDAGLIAAAQRVEHYEMAGYGTARTFAKHLKETAAAKLLQATLDEEVETDEALSELAETNINLQAV